MKRGGRQDRTPGGIAGWRGTLALLVALFAGYQWAQSRPIERRPGVLAPDEPAQIEVDAAEPLDAGHEYRLTPRARFSATVRVLARERYYIDALAPLAPVDLAVGWGPMSDSAVLAAFDISQSNRFYYWHADEMPCHAGRSNRIPRTGTSCQRALLSIARCAACAWVRSCGSKASSSTSRGRMAAPRAPRCGATTLAREPARSFSRSCSRRWAADAILTG